MSQASEAQAPEAKESQGFLHRLFGRVEHEIPGRDSRSRSASGSALDLDDIQGFILRGYRMPMVRHFLLTVGVPAEARKLLGRLVSGDETEAPPISRAASPTIASTSGSPGPVLLRWKSRIVFPHSRSNRSVPSSPERPPAQ